MRILIAAVAVVMLAGCASTAISVRDAKPVPADEVYAFQSKPGVDSGKITVVRDSGAVGSGCDIVVYVDGRKAAKIGTGQKATFTFLPAPRTLEQVWLALACAQARRLKLSPRMSRPAKKVCTESAAICRVTTLAPTSNTTEIENHQAASGRFFYCPEKAMQASAINYQPMTTIRLHGQLRQFGKSFRLAVKSPAEAIKALCVQIPGFERFLSNAKSRGLEFAVFRDKRNIGEKELSYNGAGDIRIAPVVVGSKRGGILQTIVGAILIVVGLFSRQLRSAPR